MNAEVEQVQRAHQRISALQHTVAEQERANQHKSKELMQREQRIQEQEVILAKRESIFQAQLEQRKLAKRNRASLIAPILLITCCAAGYLAFEQINQQRQYFEQVKTAQKHVDKLSRVLNLTQERMVSSTGDIELVETALKNSVNQVQVLEAELLALKSALIQSEKDKDVWGFALASINASAENLAYGASRAISQTTESAVLPEPSSLR